MIGIIGDEVIVDDMPMAKADVLGGLVRRLQQSGIERITIERGVTTEEIGTFLDAVTSIDPVDAPQNAAAFPPLPHIRVGRVTVGQRATGSLTDMATIKRLYADAVSVASSVWTARRPKANPTPRWHGR